MSPDLQLAREVIRRLIRSKFYWFGEPEDLEQVALEQVIRATPRFDSHRGSWPAFVWLVGRSAIGKYIGRQSKHQVANVELSTEEQAVDLRDPYAHVGELEQRAAKIKKPRERKFLSKRQRQVLVLLCHGLSREEMAETLGISSESVKTHKKALAEKIGSNNTAQMVLFAVRHRVIDPWS